MWLKNKDRGDHENLGQDGSHAGRGGGGNDLATECELLGKGVEPEAGEHHCETKENPAGSLGHHKLLPALQRLKEPPRARMLALPSHRVSEGDGGHTAEDEKGEGDVENHMSGALGDRDDGADEEREAEDEGERQQDRTEDHSQLVGVGILKEEEEEERKKGRGEEKEKERNSGEKKKISQAPKSIEKDRKDMKRAQKTDRKKIATTNGKRTFFFVFFRLFFPSNGDPERQEKESWVGGPEGD